MSDTRSVTTQEAIKAGAAVASTAGAIAGVAASSPALVGAAIAVGAYALYKTLTSEDPKPPDTSAGQADHSQPGLSDQD